MKKGFSVFREDTLETAIQNLCHGNKQKSTPKTRQQIPFKPSHQNKTKKRKQRGKNPSYLLPLTLNNATGLEQVGFFFNALPRI